MRAKQVSSLHGFDQQTKPAQVQVRQDVDTDNSKLSVQDTNYTTATSLLEPKIKPMSKLCGFHQQGGRMHSHSQGLPYRFRDLFKRHRRLADGHWPGGLLVSI